MRKKSLLAQALVLAMTASTITGFSTSEINAAATPKLNTKGISIEKGSKKVLTVKKTAGIKKIVSISWKSNKTTVATVKKKNSTAATVVGKSSGTAKITASVKYKTKKTLSKKLTCTVKVKDKLKATITPTAVPTPTPTATPVPTPVLATTLKDAVDFNVGTVISYDGKNSFQDERFTKITKENFDIVSFENEMKGYSLLDDEASQASEDGMPVCKFEQADEMVQWAVNNGLKVRGHVLIWEASMSESFFHVGYDEEKELVDADTLKKRMQNYCKQVVTHFEKKFPGTVIAWDVVNEAIDAGATETDPTTGLYLYTTGKFYQILGGDYIKYAFQYAKEAVAAAKEINPNSEILLYYNDFNTFQYPKTDRIIELIRYLNKDPQNPLLDCMGMEGYVQYNWPDPADVSSALKKYAKEGVKIGVNELTVRMNEKVAGHAITEKDVKDHATKYAKLFRVYYLFNEKYPNTLTNVSIWGLTDHPELKEFEEDGTKNYDYDIYGTHSGIFTEEYEKKQVFDDILTMLNSLRK